MLTYVDYLRGRGYEHAQAINLAGDTTVAPYFDALWVGGAGNVKLTTVYGETVTFTSVPAGTMLPVRGSVVYSTANGTTASNVVALWSKAGG